MNKLEYYTRQKESWEDLEVEQLKIEYQEKEMTISQIADIHKRTPGSISYKIYKLGITTRMMLSRGHQEYKNSDLYKEVIETAKLKDAEKKIKKASIKKESPVVKNDIAVLKDDIAVLKNDIKEVLRLINAIYQFETE